MNDYEVKSCKLIGLLLEALHGHGMYNGMSEDTSLAAAADDDEAFLGLTAFSGEADMNR